MLYQKRPMGPGTQRFGLFVPRKPLEDSDYAAWLQHEKLWRLLPDEYRATLVEPEQRTNASLLDSLPWALWGATHQRSRCAMRVDEVANPLQLLMEERTKQFAYEQIPLNLTPAETSTLVESGCSSEFALERLLWMYTEPQWELSVVSKYLEDRALVYVEFEHATTPVLNCSFAYHVFVFPKHQTTSHRVLCLDAGTHVTTLARNWMNNHGQTA